MKLTLLFGGASFEHEISIVSAITVMQKLSGFTLDFVFCDQDHSFYRIEASQMKAKFFSSGDYKKSPRLHVTRGGFEQRGLLGTKRLEGTVLSLIHGGDGEDGSISALLDFYDIAYIGPRKEAAMLSFDKAYTKWLAASVGVKTLPCEVLSRGELPGMEYPIIIKPARLGSSIGVSVVKEAHELSYALDVAFEFDERVVIEPFIAGVKEYNLAGYKGAGGMVYSIVEEPQKQEFLDFDKKYRDFSRSERAGAAAIDEALRKRLQRAFDALYTPLFEGALIRCDFFVIEGEVYLNEINPIPGSLAHYLFEDFSACVRDLCAHLPRPKRPRVSYQYIHSINQAKGK
ncbi:MAG: D-alanine--D-alanine ligase [Campylobacterales bacterium]|nr:D-alanine--D-alanine ligase [Campylobacterales bacterium]